MLLIEATAGTKLFHQLKQYGVKSIIAVFEPVYFTNIQLMDKSQEPFDWDNLDKMMSIKKGNASFDETYRRSWWHWSRLQLAYYFGELEITGNIYCPFLKSSAVDTSYIVTSIRAIFSGLAAPAVPQKGQEDVQEPRQENDQGYEEGDEFGERFEQPAQTFAYSSQYDGLFQQQQEL